MDSCWWKDVLQIGRWNSWLWFPIQIMAYLYFRSTSQLVSVWLNMAGPLWFFSHFILQASHNQCLDDPGYPRSVLDLSLTSQALPSSTDANYYFQDIWQSLSTFQQTEFASSAVAKRLDTIFQYDLSLVLQHSAPAPFHFRFHYHFEKAYSQILPSPIPTTKKYWWFWTHMNHSSTSLNSILGPAPHSTCLDCSIAYDLL